MTTLLPQGVSVRRGPGVASSLALSPDGRTLVVAATGPDGPQLYKRALDRVDATPIAGTERASSPFFSWDGAWIGFFADARLKRVPVAGGAAVDIVAITGPGYPAGASWGPDDRIVFTYGADGRLQTVDARGGPAQPPTEVQSGHHPVILPDGQTLLFGTSGWIYALDRRAGRAAASFETLSLARWSFA
jgi:Tol biopolymer transport system component